MCETKTKTKPDAAGNCSWRGDSPEPELDDLAHHDDHHPHPPAEVCSWQGDSPEPELDDVAHNHEISPRTRATSHAEPKLVDIDPKPLDTPTKASKTPPERLVTISSTLSSKSNIDFVEKAPSAPPADKPEKAPADEATDEALHNKASQGVHQAFDLLLSAVTPSSSQPAPDQPAKTEPKEGDNPSGKENYVPPEPPEISSKFEAYSAKCRKSKEEKEKAKKEKEEAKKVEKERKAKEKEEKKRLKKEKENDRREQRRVSKERKKSKGKEPVSPPHSEAPVDMECPAVTDLHHHHPGCRICQHPEEQGTMNFLKESLDTWQSWPSFYDLTVAAKKLLGMGDTNESRDTKESRDTQQATKTPTLSEQELIEHIAAHIDRHIHRHFDLQPHEGVNHATSKAPPHLARHEGPEDASPTHHGLDGNKDWPMAITPGHILRSLEPASAPDIGFCQSPSRDYSPCRPPTSRCVSPWCEHLGFKLNDSPKRNSTPWLRRGFNSSPSRMRSVPTAPCLHAPLCPHGYYHEPPLYACVPVSLVPALCLESPCCGHSGCHYTSPIMSPYPFNFEPLDTAETIPPSTPRRSFSVNETQIML